MKRKAPCHPNKDYYAKDRCAPCYFRWRQRNKSVYLNRYQSIRNRESQDHAYNMGLSWTKTEEEWLQKLLMEGLTFPEIGKILERSISAVQNKIQKLKEEGMIFYAQNF